MDYLGNCPVPDRNGFEYAHLPARCRKPDPKGETDMKKGVLWICRGLLLAAQLTVFSYGTKDESVLLWGTAVISFGACVISFADGIFRRQMFLILPGAIYFMIALGGLIVGPLFTQSGILIWICAILYALYALLDLCSITVSYLLEKTGGNLLDSREDDR